MGIDEQEREQAILDAATQLLLRHGYNKTTMSDVADAVGLHRGLVYLLFPSKDDLVEAIITRELNRYGAEWVSYLEADPSGGSVASLYRTTLQVLKGNSLRAAIHTQDEQVFGKYLRKPGNVFARLPKHYLTRDYLEIMQKMGVVRQDVNVAAMAFIMDALTPALLQVLSSRVAEARGATRPANLPSDEELMETIAEMLDRMLTPAEGRNFAAAKATMLQELAQIQTQFKKDMQ